MVPLCTVCCKGLSRSNHNGLNGPTLRIAGKMQIMQTIKIMCLAVGSTGAKCFQSARTQFHLGIFYHPFPFPFPLPPASRVRRFTAAINCAAWSGVLRLENTAQGCFWGVFCWLVQLVILVASGDELLLGRCPAFRLVQVADMASTEQCLAWVLPCWLVCYCGYMCVCMLVRCYLRWGMGG